MIQRRALEPSSHLRKFGLRIAKGAGDYPIADIGCGSGRNAIFIAHMGCTVFCIDKDLSRLPIHKFDLSIQDRLKPLCLDVLKERWPFAPRTLGGAVIVDFLPWSLLSRLGDSLMPDGCILLETVSGRGGNYLELPEAGQLESIFKNDCNVEFYQERRVGPLNSKAVTVKMFARRKS